MKRIWMSVLIMAVVSYLIRSIPLTLFRKPVRSRFLRSFLYYVPYITLALMTFPAILHVSDSVFPGLCGFVTGIVLTWRGSSLLLTAVICCAVVFLSGLLL